MRYDITLKTLFQQAPPHLLQLLTGSAAQALLTVEYPAVRARYADLVVRLQDDRVYHLELQSTPDPLMPWRMLEYYSLIYQQYDQEPVQQVLYVGKAQSTMPSAIAHQRLRFTYDVLDIRTVDGRSLLASASLEDQLVALLCAGGTDAETIRRLLTSIVALPGHARQEALEKLMILAGLRDIEQVVIEEIRRMAIDIDLMENRFFRELFEEGLQEGRQEGQQEGERRLLARLLEQRFGALPDWARQRLMTADVTTLERWSGQLLGATALEEVFR